MQLNSISIFFLLLLGNHRMQNASGSSSSIVERRFQILALINIGSIFTSTFFTSQIKSASFPDQVYLIIIILIVCWIPLYRLFERWDKRRSEVDKYWSQMFLKLLQIYATTLVFILSSLSLVMLNTMVINGNLTWKEALLAIFIAVLIGVIGFIYNEKCRNYQEFGS